MKKLRTGQLVLDAMLAAMCAVLAYFSVTFGTNVKVTFESIPILIGSLLFGPVDGMLIGGVGTLLYQLLGSGYGITVTTPLWILPYVVAGGVTGWYAKRCGFELSRARTVGIVLLNELLITLLNTGAIYADSKIYGYYYPGIVLGVLALRLAICVARALIYAFVAPLLVKQLKKTVRTGAGRQGEQT